MNSFKQRCIALRKKDYTLNEIVKITGRSKTSVYFHIKNVSLSESKLSLIAEASRKRGQEAAARRKGKSFKPFKPFKTWTPELVLLLGHLSFDGEIVSGSCAYNNRSQSLIARVEGLMKMVYDFPPCRHLNLKSGVHKISYYNVELQAFLKNKAEELFRKISTMEPAHKREFLRAFFDDEGCMDVRLDRNLRRIRGYQKDTKTLELVQVLLTHFNIASKRQGKNEIVISSKDNLKKFRKEINFSEGVCLNPKRANSIWKKPIEKRALLDMAIESYKM